MVHSRFISILQEAAADFAARQFVPQRVARIVVNVERSLAVAPGAILLRQSPTHGVDVVLPGFPNDAPFLWRDGITEQHGVLHRLAVLQNLAPTEQRVLLGELLFFRQLHHELHQMSPFRISRCPDCCLYPGSATPSTFLASALQVRQAVGLWPTKSFSVRWVSLVSALCIWAQERK